MIANHGRIEKYNHKFEGRNSRLDSIQAAILSVKLKKLDIWTDNRILAANTYIDELKNMTGIKVPKKNDSVKHVYHLFVIQHPERDKLKEYLRLKKIETGIHYPIALPKLQAFNYINGNYDEFIACKIDKDLLSLPIGGHISANDARLVAELIRSY
ncbi:erythromycin biosynthesis sensory transduction protein eryC1, partial [Candidatus Woesearchaeota archaeon]|nr:erythromycin biosynthesis sensory transduction protein eryC1 [Candidatus Woesearchaeota archaeon]